MLFFGGSYEKTLLNIFFALLAAVGMVLTGCEQPPFSAELSPTTQLEKPELSVEAWKGAVVLSWKPVANADKYVVVRKDTATGISVTLTDDHAAHYYVDKAGFNSGLRHEGSYSYTVEALSADPGNKQLLVNSVSDWVEVRANIPGRTEQVVTAPSADALTAAYLRDKTGAELVEVYWDVGADLENQREELLYTYQVEYLYGDDEKFPYINLTEAEDSSSLTDLGSYTKYTAFPLVDGDSKIRITAYWDSGVGNYYAPASVTKNFKGEYQVLAPVSEIIG